MKRLNKKGFTLVELLAVIVVLAVIMVIATQVIGNVMATSRANSFASTVRAIKKGAETACTIEETLDEDTLKMHVEYSDVELDFDTDADSNVVIKVYPEGKFLPLDSDTLKGSFDGEGVYTYVAKSAGATEDPDDDVKEHIEITTSCIN